MDMKLWAVVYNSTREEYDAIPKSWLCANAIQATYPIENKSKTLQMATNGDDIPKNSAFELNEVKWYKNKWYESFELAYETAFRLTKGQISKSASEAEDRGRGKRQKKRRIISSDEEEAEVAPTKKGAFEQSAVHEFVSNQLMKTKNKPPPSLPTGPSNLSLSTKTIKRSNSVVKSTKNSKNSSNFTKLSKFIKPKTSNISNLLGCVKSTPETSNITEVPSSKLNQFFSKLSLKTSDICQPTIQSSEKINKFIAHQSSGTGDNSDICQPTIQSPKTINQFVAHQSRGTGDNPKTIKSSCNLNKSVTHQSSETSDRKSQNCSVSQPSNTDLASFIDITPNSPSEMETLPRTSPLRNKKNSPHKQKSVKNHLLSTSRSSSSITKAKLLKDIKCKYGKKYKHYCPTRLKCCILEAIIHCLCTMSCDIKLLVAESKKRKMEPTESSSKEVSVQPESIDFLDEFKAAVLPFCKVEDLLEFDRHLLQDPAFKQKLVEGFVYGAKGDPFVAKTARNVLRVLATTEVYSKFSFSGASNKLSFKTLEIYSLIKSVVMTVWSSTCRNWASLLKSTISPYLTSCNKQADQEVADVADDNEGEAVDSETESEVDGDDIDRSEGEMLIDDNDETSLAT